MKSQQLLIVAKFSARFRENFNWELTWYCWVAAPASDWEFLASLSSSCPRLFSAWASSSLSVHIFFRRKQFAELRLPEIHYANIVQGIFITRKCICKWLQYCKKNRHWQIQYVVYMNECFFNLSQKEYWSRIHEFVEVSGQNLESSQSWGFCVDFLIYREEGMVFYEVFLLSPLQCTVTKLQKL